MTALCLALLAVGFAAVVSRQAPRGGGVRLLSGTEIWLTTVFVTAMLALLFGASAWLGVAFRGRGAREALESLRARADALDRQRSGRGAPATGNGGGGSGGRDGGAVADDPGQEAGMSPASIMEVGGWLALLYVVGWLVLG